MLDTVVQKLQLLKIFQSLQTGKNLLLILEVGCDLEEGCFGNEVISEGRARE